MPGRGTAAARTLLLLDPVSTAQLFLSVGISGTVKQVPAFLTLRSMHPLEQIYF